MLELFMPIPVKARDPFMRIKKQVDPKLNIKAADIPLQLS